MERQFQQWQRQQQQPQQQQPCAFGSCQSMERITVSVPSNRATSPAIAVPVRFSASFAAWRKARRGKRPSNNQLAFEGRWLSGLLALTHDLQQGRWQPRRTVSFVVKHPKTREIHAPDFADRVVHHLLVSRLEPLYEPIFIHHSYANRKGKGSHGAVDALQRMMRAVQTGQNVAPQSAESIRRVGFSPPSSPVYESVVCADGGLKPALHCLDKFECKQSPVGRVLTRHAGIEQAWLTCADGGLKPALQTRADTPHYLQLDIHNFFNTIHRPTLYAMLCKRLGQALQRHWLTPANEIALRSLCHKLLVQPAPVHVRDRAAAAAVPPHKRLANARPSCGLPVGNLTSQFFANVYLNALDQFVKHTLKVRHYVRYVDDFVLLSNSKAQLQQCKLQIEDFLASELQLRLNDKFTLAPLSHGVDFLGYRVFTQHRWVRPRVQRHCYAKLREWNRTHRHAHRVTAVDFNQLRALLASYWGHFRHANSVRLRHQIFAKLPWLHQYFDIADDASITPNAPARWVVSRHQTLRRQGFCSPVGWVHEPTRAVQAGKTWVQEPTLHTTALNASVVAWGEQLYREPQQQPPDLHRRLNSQPPLLGCAALTTNLRTKLRAMLRQATHFLTQKATTMKPLYLKPLIAALCTTAAAASYAACPTTPGRFLPVAATPSEVLDTKTQLVWARCSVGQTWSGSTCTGTATAMPHEAALTHAAGQSGWRLPNVKELASLADKGCINPAIDASVFPNTVSQWYWTSSPYVGNSNDAWFVNFYNGLVNYNLRYDVSRVRLVRASQ